MLTLWLSIAGELETLLSEDLYPYRVPLTVLGTAALVAMLAIAYRRGWHRIALKHPLATGLVGIPLVIGAVVGGNYLLSPLWERTVLYEASPLAPIENVVAADMAPVASPAVGVTRQGVFKGADDFHFGRGEAYLIESGDGTHVIRFENFSVRNGPDLYVYLSREIDGKRVDEMLNLGRLKATDGAFNYEVPAGVDLSQVESVIVWCKQFSTLFAEAPLS